MAGDALQPTQADHVRQHFDTHAQDWESIYARRDLPSAIIQQRRDRVLAHVRQLGLPPGSTVVDIGCGAGVTAAELARLGYHVIGLDVAESMLELARRRCTDLGVGDRVTFALGDSESLDLPDDSADLVVAMGLIEYLQWDRWALQEMWRVLKPGGHLIVTVPNQLRLAWSRHWLLRAADRTERLIRRGVWRIDHYRRRLRVHLGRQEPETANAEATSAPPPAAPSFQRRQYVLAELRELLRKIEFDVVHCDSHGFGPLPFARLSNRLSLAADAVLARAKRWGLLRSLRERGVNGVVLARKPLDEPTAWRAAVGRDAELVTRFEAEHRRFIDRRAEWLRQHPRFAGLTARDWAFAERAPQRVLVISPHPDDELIGCGGTMAKLMRAGAHVTVLHTCDGSSTAALRDAPDHVRHSIRVREAQAVGEEMGVSAVELWGEPDDLFTCADGHVVRLAALLDRVRPELIFVPFVHDAHPNHVTANELLARALTASRVRLDQVQVASYEVWSLVPADRVCTIDDVWAMKRRLLLRYRTAMKPVDYVYTCAVRHAFAARTLLGHDGLAEAFLVLSGRTWFALATGGDSFITSTQRQRTTEPALAGSR